MKVLYCSECGSSDLEFSVTMYHCLDCGNRGEEPESESFTLEESNE